MAAEHEAPDRVSPRNGLIQQGYLASQGGRRRRHRYLTDFRSFWIPVLWAIVTTCLAYMLFISSRGGVNWQNVAIVWAVLALVPILVAFALSAFRRHSAPITAAVTVTAIVYVFSVALLSAMRLPVSYGGLAIASLPVILIMSYANLRFYRSARGRVGLLSFPGADKVSTMFGGGLTLISDSAEQIGEIDTLLIDGHEHHTREWAAFINDCYLSGVDIVPWSRFMEITQGTLDINSFEVHHIAYSPSQLLYARLKRVFDVLAVILTLPLSLLMGGLVALLILVRDGRPILFKQERLGYAGSVFTIYKFRTMRGKNNIGAATKSDSRVIPGLGLLRRSRLDELPQFYNILRGEMSLIGPRPEAIDLATWYEGIMPEYAHRLLILPGITGWAQVNYGYTSNPSEARQKLSYDLYYIKNIL